MNKSNAAQLLYQYRAVPFTVFRLIHCATTKNDFGFFVAMKKQLLSHEEFAILPSRFAMRGNNGDKFLHTAAKSK